MSRPHDSKFIYFLLLFSLVSFACVGFIIDIPTRSESKPSSTRTAAQAKSSTATMRPSATLPATPTASATEKPIKTPSPTSTSRPTSSPTASLSPTPSIPMIIAPGWEDQTVETVCLAVWDHYPQSMGSFSRADEIAAETRGLLSMLRIQVVPLGESCQAELTVMLVFQAVGTQYSDEGVLYTGALSHGQLTLSSEERERLVFPVSSMALLPVDPSASGWHLGNPAAAPYEVVWREPVLSGLAQIWGDAVLFAGLEQDEWQADARVVLNDSDHSPIQTQQASSAGVGTSSSELQVEHNPNPAAFIPEGVSNREFTCYFQTTIKAPDVGVHIVAFGMDYLVEGKQVRNLQQDTGPWSAVEFADWYDCLGAFIPAGEVCTDENNWLGSDRDVPFIGIWYYRGVDEQGKLVSGEAEIECVPE